MSDVICLFTRIKLNTESETKPVQSEPKIKKPKTDEAVKQFFRDSLDNEKVKAKYNLTEGK